MRRTERLFAIAEVLRAARRALTARELSERFAVSVRTIYRDLDALREAHFPLLADAGPGGGYALDPAYRLPPINFTAREAAILIATAEWLERLRLIPFLDTLTQAVEKVRKALPARLSPQVETLSRSLSFVGVPSLPVRPEVRRVVERAWFEDRPLEITYDGYRGRSRRSIRIRSVVLDGTVVLLNCTDLDLDEARQFQLQRIVAAREPDRPVSGRGSPRGDLSSQDRGRHA